MVQFFNFLLLDLEVWLLKNFNHGFYLVMVAGLPPGKCHCLLTTLIVKPCKQDIDWTVSARTVQLGTHTSYDKRTTLLAFQGQGSKVKVTCYTLLLNLVNTIQIEPFQPGPSNLAHILLMTRGRHLTRYRLNCFSKNRQTWCIYIWEEDDTYWFTRSGAKGQGHMLDIVVKPC